MVWNGISLCCWEQEKERRDFIRLLWGSNLSAFCKCKLDIARVSVNAAFSQRSNNRRATHMHPHRDYTCPHVNSNRHVTPMHPNRCHTYTVTGLLHASIFTDVTLTTCEVGWANSLALSWPCHYCLHSWGTLVPPGRVKDSPDYKIRTAGETEPVVYLANCKDHKSYVKISSFRSGRPPRVLCSPRVIDERQVIPCEVLC